MLSLISITTHGPEFILLSLSSIVTSLLLIRGKKIGYVLLAILAIYCVTSSSLIQRIRSKDYVLTLQTNLNQSYLYDSPLSTTFLNINRIAYNKVHYLVRLVLEDTLEIFDLQKLDSSGYLFFWELPAAFVGATFVKKRTLIIAMLILILCLIKGSTGLAIIVPWIVYLEIILIKRLKQKYVG